MCVKWFGFTKMTKISAFEMTEVWLIWVRNNLEFWTIINIGFSDNHSYQRWRCGWDFIRFGIGHRDGSYYLYPYKFFINAKKQIHTIFSCSSAGQQSWRRVLQMFLFEYYLDILINWSIQVQVSKKLMEHYCTSAVVKDPRYHLS